MPKQRIVVLISGSGSNLQAIMDAIDAGRINGDIVRVISNKADAYGITRAENANIPTTVLDHKTFTSREAFDQKMQVLIDETRPDFIILAGFMRILSADFVRHFSGRLLNIHPSLLPLYKGLHTHKRALESGDTHHGCTVHVVTEELDEGPLLIQAPVPILANDTEATLQARVHTREHIAYPLAIEWLCNGRLRINSDSILLDDQPLPAEGFTLPYDD